MWHKLIASTLLTTSLSVVVVAQEKDNTPPPPPQKTEDVIIRKKGTNNHEKTTIVIDGENITINGKPFKEFKSADLDVILRNHDMAFNKLRDWPSPNVRVFNDDRLFLKSNKAFLGVSSERAENGAKIVSISKESAAEKAGLQKGDIITKVDDKKIADNDDLYEAISKYNPGDNVQVTYLRDGKENTLSATLGKNEMLSKLDDLHFNADDFNFAMPDMSQFKNFNYNFVHKPRLGLEIQDVEEGKGVTVLGTDNNTPASKSGLQRGDIITEADGKAVDSVEDLKGHLKSIKDGDTIQLKYKRDGKVQNTEIKIPKKLKTADL